MTSNTEIIHDVPERIVNQKRIEACAEYFGHDYIACGVPFVGMGFSRDGYDSRHIIKAINPGSPADGTLQAGDELALWVEDERRCRATYEGMSEGIQSHRGGRG